MPDIYPLRLRSSLRVDRHYPPPGSCDLALAAVLPPHADTTCATPPAPWFRHLPHPNIPVHCYLPTAAFTPTGLFPVTNRLLPLLLPVYMTPVPLYFPATAGSVAAGLVLPPAWPPPRLLRYIPLDFLSVIHVVLLPYMWVQVGHAVLRLDGTTPVSTPFTHPQDCLPIACTFACMPWTGPCLLPYLPHRTFCDVSPFLFRTLYPPYIALGHTVDLHCCRRCCCHTWFTIVFFQHR